MLQGQRDLTTASAGCFWTELTPLVNARYAGWSVIYQVENEDNPRLHLLSAYAGDGTNPHPQSGVQFGDGLIGQCAMDQAVSWLVSDIPPDAVPINPALLRVMPNNLVVLPVLFENQVKESRHRGSPSVSSFTTWLDDLP